MSNGLAEQLRAVMAESGVSRYRIAVECGLSQSTLCQFCLGRRGLSLASLERIWKYLGLSIERKEKRRGQHLHGSGGKSANRRRGGGKAQDHRHRRGR